MTDETTETDVTADSESAEQPTEPTEPKGEQTEPSETGVTESEQNSADTSEEKVELKPLQKSASAIAQTGEIDLDALMDVPVTLSVEIGKKRMPIEKLISLTPGSIVELDRDLSSPLDLLVNGTLIARGEVVVMGKKFGLRLVDVVSPQERIKQLG